jgi:hypothetical protein
MPIVFKNFSEKLKIKNTQKIKIGWKINTFWDFLAEYWVKKFK